MTKAYLIPLCTLAMAVHSLPAMDMTSCEKIATAVPSDSWTLEQWQKHESALMRWKEKKGTERYTPDDPETSAYRVPDDATSFKELEALDDAQEFRPEDISRLEHLAYQVPSDYWNSRDWAAYRDAKKALGLLQ